MTDRDDGTFVLDRSPSHLLHRAQQMAAKRFDASFGSDEATLRQFAVLAAVASKPGQTQTDLVNVTGIDRSTLADMVQRMQDNGLVARVRAATDGRAKAVTLTAQGRSVLAQASPRAKAADDALLAALPKNKRSAFLDTLKMLAEAVIEEEEAPKPRRAARKGARTAKRGKAKRATRGAKAPKAARKKRKAVRR